MPEAILMALRDIAEARGFELLDEAADLSQKSLYKILSDTKDAKPRFETLDTERRELITELAKLRT